MCVDASDPAWVDMMLSLCAQREREATPEVIGWPVGTLVHNKANGRRGAIRMSSGNDCSIEFSDGIKNIWVTTWDVVLRNYQSIP